jgi:hypothetical protein
MHASCTYSHVQEEAQVRTKLSLISPLYLLCTCVLYCNIQLQAGVKPDALLLGLVAKICSRERAWEETLSIIQVYTPIYLH